MTDASNNLALELEGEHLTAEVTACDSPEERELRQLADLYVK